jgi:hypothetical protein
MAPLVAALAACTYTAELPVAAAPAIPPVASGASVEVSGTERFDLNVKPQTPACSAHSYKVALGPYAGAQIRNAFAAAFADPSNAAPKLAVAVDDVSLRMRCIAMNYSGQCTAETAVTLAGTLTPASGDVVRRRVTREASAWSSEGMGCERGVEAIQSAVGDAVTGGSADLIGELRKAAN